MPKCVQLLEHSVLRWVRHMYCNKTCPIAKEIKGFVSFYQFQGCHAAAIDIFLKGSASSIHVSVISASGKSNLQIAAFIPPSWSSCASNALASLAEASDLFSWNPCVSHAIGRLGFYPQSSANLCSPGGRMALWARLKGLANDGRAADISRLQWRPSQAASKLRTTSFGLQGIP